MRALAIVMLLAACRPEAKSPEGPPVGGNRSDAAASEVELPQFAIWYVRHEAGGGYVPGDELLVVSDGTLELLPEEGKPGEPRVLQAVTMEAAELKTLADLVTAPEIAKLESVPPSASGEFIRLVIAAPGVEKDIDFHVRQTPAGAKALVAELDRLRQLAGQTGTAVPPAADFEAKHWISDGDREATPTLMVKSDGEVSLMPIGKGPVKHARAKPYEMAALARALSSRALWAMPSVDLERVQHLHLTTSSGTKTIAFPEKPVPPQALAVLEILQKLKAQAKAGGAPGPFTLRLDFGTHEVAERDRLLVTADGTVEYMPPQYDQYKSRVLHRTKLDPKELDELRAEFTSSEFLALTDTSKLGIDSFVVTVRAPGVDKTVELEVSLTDRFSAALLALDEKVGRAAEPVEGVKDYTVEFWMNGGPFLGNIKPEAPLVVRSNGEVSRGDKKKQVQPAELARLSSVLASPALATLPDSTLADATASITIRTGDKVRVLQLKKPHPLEAAELIDALWDLDSFLNR